MQKIKHKRKKPVLRGYLCGLSLEDDRKEIIAAPKDCSVVREHYAYGRKRSAQLARSLRSLDLLFKELVTEGYLTRQDPMFPDGYPGDYRHDHHWQPKKWHRR